MWFAYASILASMTVVFPGVEETLVLGTCTLVSELAPLQRASGVPYHVFLELPIPSSPHLILDSFSLPSSVGGG